MNGGWGLEMNDMIVTDRLSKCYGSFRAVSGVSLQVKKGEIYGFLGLNGAGKTTTIRMLLGMIKPTSGAAYLKGKRVSAEQASLWNDAGCMVETPYAYPDLTVRENLEMMRKLRGLADRRAVDRIMEKLQLIAYRDKKAKHLSLGNAQRLGIAKALIHEPDILILDEPSNGLDPAGIFEIRHLLQDLTLNHGTTIFISSHILGEIAKLATRIGIIHGGALIQEVDSRQLDRLRQRRLLVDSKGRRAAQAVLEKASIPYRMTDDGIIEAKDKAAVDHPDRVATLLVQAGCPPTLLKVEEEDLESYFFRTIGLNGGEAK